MEILYTARFLRSLRKLSEEARAETIATMRLFESDQKHPILKPYKLK